MPRQRNVRASQRRKDNSNRQPNRKKDNNNSGIIVPWNIDEFNGTQQVFNNIVAGLREKGIDFNRWNKYPKNGFRKEIYRKVELTVKSIYEDRDDACFIVASNSNHFIVAFSNLFPIIWSLTTRKWAFSCDTQTFKDSLYAFMRDDEYWLHRIVGSEAWCWIQPEVMSANIDKNASMFHNILSQRYLQNKVTIFLMRFTDEFSTDNLGVSLLASIGYTLKNFIVDVSQTILVQIEEDPDQEVKEIR